MGHNHTHQHNSNIGNSFKLGIILNIIFIIIELTVGFVANSMALVADAGHNLSDVLALAFSWIAIIVSQRKPTMKFTYGFRRSTILIALLNTILLLVAVFFIVSETIVRLGKPKEVDPQLVILVAAIGIVINGFTAWLFMKEKGKDLNIKSAFTHFMADTLVSLGVVVSGVIMVITKVTWIDSVVTLLIAAVILYSTYHLLVDSVNLALDAVPENIKIGEVATFLESLPEVTGIHDLHIWALSTTEAALTVHLSTAIQTDMAFIHSIQHALHEKFEIGHTTIQVEYGSGSNDCDTNCS